MNIENPTFPELLNRWLYPQDKESSEGIEPLFGNQITGLLDKQFSPDLLITDDNTFTIANYLNWQTKNGDDEYSVFKQNFLEKVRNTPLEFGIHSDLDNYVSEAINKFSTIGREWIDRLFIDYFHDPSVLCSILRTIAHLDYRKIYPQGMTMATAATRHIDFEVRECGIRCFENWEDPEALKILSNIDIKEKWLREYLGDVINYLEEIQSNVNIGQESN